MNIKLRFGFDTCKNYEIISYSIMGLRVSQIIAVTQLNSLPTKIKSKASRY